MRPTRAAPSGGPHAQYWATTRRSQALWHSGLSCSLRPFGFFRAVSASTPWRPGVSSAVVPQRRWSRGFRRRSVSRVLRHKEWTLLQRDPWLVSQTLMQILYLIPPTLLLWVTFHDRNDSFVVLIPVVVMAAGQLARGGSHGFRFRARTLRILSPPPRSPRNASFGPRSKQSLA